MCLRLSHTVRPIQSFTQQLCITVLLRKTLPGVVITVPFLYKDDILYAPENQFVFGKLKMKHLLAKYIWEECATAHLSAAHFFLVDF